MYIRLKQRKHKLKIAQCQSYWSEPKLGVEKFHFGPYGIGWVLISKRIRSSIHYFNFLSSSILHRRMRKVFCVPSSSYSSKAHKCFVYLTASASVIECCVWNTCFIGKGSKRKQFAVANGICIIKIKADTEEEPMQVHGDSRFHRKNTHFSLSSPHFSLLHM